jgi:hypothetical protein
VDGSFTLMADMHMRVAEAERERALKRLGAAIAVILIHILFLIALLTAGHVVSLVRRPPKETLLLLPPLPHQRETNPSMPLVPLPLDRPVNIPPTITINPPPAPPTTQKPEDIMQALGRELACGAGSYENLSPVQREACRRQPWRFKKNEKGVIVLDRSTPPPPPDTTISGIDASTQIQRTTDPCVAEGNTHSECIHKTIFGR